MKVRITFEADERLRRAINNRYGDDGLADYQTVKQHFIMYGESASDDLIWELEAAEGIEHDD